MKHRLTQYKVSLVRESTELKEGPRVIRDMASMLENIADMKALDREHLRAYWLNARHQLIGFETISIGTLTASLAHPREIFKGAILANAAGIILVHNHPSGDPSPSDEDNRLTNRIAQNGRFLGIDLLDHIVIAESGAYSFKTAGQL